MKSNQWQHGGYTCVCLYCWSNKSSGPQVRDLDMDINVIWSEYDNVFLSLWFTYILSWMLTWRGERHEGTCVVCKRASDIIGC